jgi:hypothetical protein
MKCIFYGIENLPLHSVVPGVENVDLYKNNIPDSM